jgi:N-dimethylarginine dimethylaminohydrolase
MAFTDERTFGGQTQVGPLRRVLVRAPEPAALARWRTFGWRAEPDPTIAAEQHEALCGLLRGAGAEVVSATGDVADDPDAVYVFDPVIVSDLGALLLRPGKEGRRVEPPTIADDLRALDVPIAFEMREPATAEGGDTMWLDERTLLVGRSYRTNDAGIDALRRALPGVEVLAFDLPRVQGPDACLHLLSLLSPLDEDLVVAYPPLMPIRLLELLAERGVAIVEVPEEEFDSQGANVLALGPRLALAVDGNPETRRRMEAAGVEVRTFSGAEISVKGDGGPTCLTRPLERG